MPFVFAIFGVLFIVAGVRGKTSDLVTLIKDDFSGQPNYFEWMIAIFLVGAIGYIDQLRTLSRMFLTLLIIGLLFSEYRRNPLIFKQFNQQTMSPLQDASASSETTQQSASLSVPTLSTLDPNEFFKLG